MFTQAVRSLCILIIPRDSILSNSSLCHCAKSTALGFTYGGTEGCDMVLILEFSNTIDAIRVTFQVLLVFNGCNLFTSAVEFNCELCCAEQFRATWLNLASPVMAGPSASVIKKFATDFRRMKSQSI